MICIVIDELSSMKRKTIWFVPKKSADLTPERWANGSIINLLVSGCEGAERKRNADRTRSGP
jgi:hypothetical protein